MLSLKSDVQTKGRFTAERTRWRGELRLDDRVIAQTMSRDWERQHGDIDQWIEKVLKRTEKRLKKIEDTIDALEKEEQELLIVKHACKEA